jgi:ribosome-associated translation inhibitor RaiA
MSVRITGDLLALDKHVQRMIKRETAAIEQSFPNRKFDIQARVTEEFDQINGHRVRCELVSTSPEHQQVIVREAKKKPEEAIKAAFTSLKPRLRRLRVRRFDKEPGSPDLRATGT